MKKILILLLTVFFGFVAKAQYPLIQNLGSDSTLIRIGQNYRGAIKGGLINMTVTDTTAANLIRIRQYPGAMVYTTNDGFLWLRNPTNTGWIQIGGGTAPTGSFWRLTGNYVPITPAGFGIGTDDPFNNLPFKTDGTTRLVIPLGGIERSASAFNKCITFDTITKSMYYTDCGGTGGAYTFPYSVVAPGNAIQLENDTTVATPDYFYGFNSAARRGFYRVPRFAVFGEDAIASQDRYFNANSNDFDIDNVSYFSVETPSNTSTLIMQDQYFRARNIIPGGFIDISMYDKYAELSTFRGVKNSYVAVYADSIRLKLSGGGTGKLLVQSMIPTTDTTTYKPWGIDSVAGEVRRFESWGAVSGGSGSTAISALTAATATNDIDNLAYQQKWNWSAASAAPHLWLNSTGGSSGTKYIQYLTSSGANTGASRVNYGTYIDLTNTGTTSTNTGLFVTSSGATNNYAIIVPNGGGNVGFGTTAPSSLLHVSGTAQFGTAGSQIGRLQLSGNTSGTVGITTAAAAGTWTMTLPVNDGDANQVLQTDGSGVTSWVTPSTGGSPAGNFGNLQINRNGAFATPASDSLDFESATGLTVKGNITSSTLTSGRVTYAGTGGVLQDDADLTFTGTQLIVPSTAGAATPSIAVTGATSTGIELLDATNGVCMTIGGQRGWAFTANYLSTDNDGQMTWNNTSNGPYGAGGSVGIGWAEAGAVKITNASTGLGKMATLNLVAGTAAANTAPLKFTSGTNLTTAEAGAMEYNGTSLFFSPSTTRLRTVLTDNSIPSNGQIPIGNGTNYTNANITSTGGTVAITNGAGTINLEATGVAGTYTPTLFNTTNVAASTASTTHYSQIGNTITVWGTVAIDATAALTLTELGMSLPSVAGAVNNAYDISGHCTFEDNTTLQVKGDVGNTRIVMRGTPQSATNNTYSFVIVIKYITP